MKTVQMNVYTFEELSEDAKQNAIDKNRDINVFHDWWDCVYWDAEKIGEILGIDIENIYFSGFWSQGDGACFEGFYSYNKGAHKKIREHAPKDETLHEIADRLKDLQSENFYNLSAQVKHRGHYSHEYCTDITVYKNSNLWGISGNVSESLSDILRDFMRWIYRQLEQEYEYLTSDEAIAETLKINEYEFTEDGKIW